ncbi:MAG: hypothetical protein ACYSTT_01555 [Planctomycetota bacterium]|jgi:hypothetical protein
MKALPAKNYILLLIILLVAVVLIVINRLGIYRPVPAFNEEAIPSLLPPSPFNQQDLIFEPTTVADFKRESIKEPRYSSKKPLYFRVLFGKEAANPMLGVIDESAGTAEGYDIVYIDENMNGDLTDDTSRKFARHEGGSRAGELEPKFEFWGPFEGQEKVKYAINIYSLVPRYSESVKGNEYYFFSYLDINEWNYFFINGKINLYPSVDEALKGTPVVLGGDCKWEISSRTQDGKSLISAGLKDINGCTLRSVRRNDEMVSPALSLLKDGKVEAEEKMKFG